MIFRIQTSIPAPTNVWLSNMNLLQQEGGTPNTNGVTVTNLGERRITTESCDEDGVVRAGDRIVRVNGVTDSFQEMMHVYTMCAKTMQQNIHLFETLR